MNKNVVYDKFEVSFLSLSSLGVQPKEIFGFLKWYGKSKDFIREKITDNELGVLANALNGLMFMHEMGPEQILCNLEDDLEFNSIKESNNLLNKLREFSDIELLIVMNMAYELLA